MARPEANDAVVAPVDHSAPSLVGNSLVSQGDSDMVRTASLRGNDSVSDMLDPKGNEFQIRGMDISAERSLTNSPQSQGDTPPRSIKPEDAFAFSNDDNSKKTVVRGDRQETMQFAPDGTLRSYGTRAADGTLTTTDYDREGKATGRRVTGIDGQTQNLEVPPGTGVRQGITVDGGNDVTLSEAGKTTNYSFAKNGNMTQTYTMENGKLNWSNFNQSGQVESTGKSETADGKTTTTTTARGFRQTVTSNDYNNAFQVERVDQRLPYSNAIDPRAQRTDNINGRADGRQDATTKFFSDPDNTYQTLIGPDGTYTTEKIKDSTGEKFRQEQGRQRVRI